jgi:hypothetical protein
MGRKPIKKENRINDGNHVDHDMIHGDEVKIQSESSQI